MAKKILLITGALSSGGAERFTAFLCNHLPGNDFEKVLVVCTLENRNYDISPDVKLINLDVPIRKSVWKIFKTLRQEKPDILFSTLTAINIIVATLSFFRSKKRVVILRESTILSEVLQFFRQPIIIQWVIKNMYPMCTVVVAQSMAMRQDMIDNFGFDANRIIQIYNPIASQPLKQECTSSTLQLITVGNVRKEKGHIRIIQSLKHLSVPFHYTIVGGGEIPETENLKAAIEACGLSKNVTLVGAVRNPFEYLSKATIFLQGSFFEGFPNCLLEANAVGLPIVAFDCPGGTREIIEEGKNGFLVPNNDEYLFAATIEKAWKHPFDASEIRRNILVKFDQQTTLNKYIDLFNSFDN